MSDLSTLLNRSGALAQQGDLIGARTVLEEAIRDHDSSPEIWVGLTIIHSMGCNFTESLRCARKAAELAPDTPQVWINLSSAAYSTGNFPLVVEALQHARGLPGCPPDVVLNLGLTLARLDRWVEAEQPLSEYLSLNPGHSAATLKLATALSKNCKIDDAVAILDEYRRHQPLDANTLAQLGRIYLESGRGQEAWDCCEQILKDYPAMPDGYFLKVDLLVFEDRLKESIDTLEHLDRLVPENIRVVSCLSNVWFKLGKPEVAIAYAREALKINPRHLQTLLLLSTALLTHDTAEAQRLIDEAEAIAPHDLSVQTYKGQLLEFIGDKQGAWECVRAALKGGAADAAAVLVAANVAPALGKADEAITLMEQLASRPGIPSSAQRALRFTLAKLCDKVGQYDRSFENAVLANRLKNVSFNLNASQVRFNRLKSVYSEAATSTLPRSRNHSELPVFIVGMPRSGTSLLEQILSCHSKVHSRGEVGDIKELTTSISYYPDGVRNLTPEKFDAMAETYLQQLIAMAPSATRITNKMPSNYFHLGLISQVFPGARIINCRRDPRDICLSNFTTDFMVGHYFTYDLETLAIVCKDYQELMEHWKQVLPISILDVRYENLIADPQTLVAKVLDFCGLEWEDACLNFHKSDRQVVTASYDQVRKPLYNTSVDRWKNYERHLEPVSRILGLHDDSYS